MRKTLEKHKAICTKIEDSKNIKLNALPVYQSINSLLVYDKKCYLQVYLDKCAYKIVNK